jgi:hypothetical protein
MRVFLGKCGYVYPANTEGVISLIHITVAFLAPF